MDDKVDLKSLDIKQDKIEQLKKAFPEVVTEGKVDFERLKLALGEEIEVGKERYGMNWPGKANLLKIIQEPSIGTLKPVKDASVDFDSTENLFIEGDSLEVLKLLQKSYYGKVKMIYIDPPYNTGNDFVYPDNYSESLDTYLRYTGQKGEEGLKLTTNAETEGRYHSKWMNMMYPRLFLARNLLKENGVIFISIDDHEVDNLKKICSEIFGDENFIGSIAWKKTSGDNAPSFAFIHDTILVFGKNNPELPRQSLNDEQKKQYKNPDNDPRGDWAESDYRSKWTKNERRNLYYPIKNPVTGEEIYPDTYSSSPRVWAYAETTHKQNEENKLVWWGVDGLSKEPKKKRFLAGHKGVNTRSVWSDAGSNDSATQEIASLFPEAPSIFDNPKPTDLIKKMLYILEKDITILDFFAGSATTAHAVLDLNKEDGGNRKFIMVQLQEPTPEDSEARKAGYKNIAEIGEERIRRVVKKIKEKEAGKLGFEDKKLDLGFKVFRLDESNFKIWDKKSDVPIQQQLELTVDNIDDNSSDEEILYEIILKSGFELSVHVERIEIQGKAVYSVDNKSLLICLENDFSQDLMKEISEMEPARVVCLDRGFSNNDQLKTNTVELMKAKGVEFKTA